MAPYNEKRAENNLQKEVHQFKANFISVLQPLKQTIDKCLQWVILTLIYYMTHKAWTLRFQKH